MSFDLETYSSTNLSSCGVHKYVESDDFEILLFGYAFNDEPVRVVDLACGEELPPELVSALYDPDVEKTGWNIAFERNCLRKYFGKELPAEQCFDTMVLAASCGLPLSLDAAGEALGLGEDKAKMKIGKQLIREFSVPCRPTKRNGQRTRNLPEHDPENWATYKEYNQRDVEVERTIRQMLLRWRPSRSEQKFWCLDQQINDRGIRVDVGFAEHAITFGDNYKERLIAEATALSGLANPNSTAQVKLWLEEQEGLTVPSLNKKVIADVIAQLSEDKAKKFMAMRSEFSKSSTKKYEAITRSVCSDEHIHGCFQFAGAGRTGRFAGRLVQLQNLPQNHMSDLDSARWLVKQGDEETFNVVYPDVSSTLSELIRTALIPEPGHRFIVADYSAIEARVVAWIAGEDWRLKVFKEGGDIYCASASQMFKVPVVKHGVNGHLRQKGKVAELACIARDSLVLTDIGLVPIQYVTKNMRVWDGRKWVKHGGVVSRGVKEVITYEGLTATPDHLVWVEGRRRPIPFGAAAASGARLLRTGDGWDKVRINKNNHTMESVETKVNMSCAGCLHMLREGDEFVAWFEDGKKADILCGSSRQEAKEQVGPIRRVPVYDITNAGLHHRYTVSNVLVHNCGYGGGVNALKAFGADKYMTDEEMVETIDHWREASPHICALWKSIEKAAIRCVARKESVISTVGSILFEYEDGVMWMTLPSGRRIAYWGMRYDESGRKVGKTLSYMGVNQTTRKWERIETWGGKLVENCLAEGTLVLTNRGLVPIESVSKSDLLWDGDKWVEHDGLIYKGYRDCINVDGVWVTPEHQVLTKEGWANAEDWNRLERVQVRLPDDYRTVYSERLARQGLVGVLVRLRQSWCHRHKGLEEKRTQRFAHFLWLSKEKLHSRAAADTRDVKASGVRSMALVSSALHESESSSLEELRGTRHNRLRALASQLRELLGRHGRFISARFRHRPDRQQSGLCSGELPVGKSDGELPKQKRCSDVRISRETNAVERSVGVKRGKVYDSIVQAATRGFRGTTVLSTRRYSKVYDLANAGEKHRFVVVGYSPLIVHNCVQSTARDCLKESMLALNAADFDIRAHVHDEVIITEPIGGRSVEEVCEIMGRELPWAKGLPLRGDGYECEYYMKD